MYLIATVCGTAPHAALRYHFLAHAVLLSLACYMHLISLFHIWCVLLLFVIAVHHHVRTNWTLTRMRMPHSQ